MASAKWKVIPGSITAPQGFHTGSVFCDVKRLGTGKGSSRGKKKDLAVLVSDVPASVAGMFTTNQVVAAPVTLSIPRARKARARAIVVNSGNANACTGEQGLTDAVEMAALTAETLGIRNDKDVLVCSTGRIGLNLPMENIRDGIRSACASLGRSPEMDTETATAIMTSDTRPKEIALEFQLDGKAVRIGGMAKGAGMIHPGMSPTGKRPATRALHATMLSFITTDASVAPQMLKKALREAVAASFNCISIDGDMSTNDTVIALANGLAGNRTIESDESEDGRLFGEALRFVCLQLAKMIVKDGEGVTKVVTLRITGARNDAEADAAARAVANSELVKTSWCGEDPNWGRIAHAIGYSNARVEIGKLDIGYCRPGSTRILHSLKQGQPTDTSLEELRTITSLEEFEIHCNLNLGPGRADFYTSDLTEEYVDFNKGE
jgi:glutamate N-acetyltransferase/amino-acid N-acetyltransferase